jgi:hypothetical protein
MANIVILAPHVDDELIGCYSILNDGKYRVTQVIYFYDLDDIRKEEALAAADFYNFDVSFDGYDAIIDRTVILYAPNVADAHPHHKAVNQYAKALANTKMYYSVDMNRDFTVLDEYDQKSKLTLLKHLYPSQQKLFDSDAKYHLFEDNTPDDSFKKIWVTFQKSATHCFPGAVSGSQYDDVSYLSNAHRHLFKFKVSIEVFHNDREIEFHQFLNWLESLYTGTLVLDYKSCEMIADDLYKQILQKYPRRYVNIDISEDGECGCSIDYMR